MSAILNSAFVSQEAKNDHVDDTTWQRFAIEYEYPVTFTANLFSTDNPTLLNTLKLTESNKQHRLSVFIDEGVIAACPTLLNNLFRYVGAHSEHMTLASEPTIMMSGEAIKSDPARLTAMQNIVAEQHIDRHSFIVGIGGGALLDAIGLVAATSHRGIRHIRIPTTVLAQNDSGVGVKNGVNQFGQKNYLGTFAPPFAVLNDYNFIKALPDRDKIAGMAEAIKVALIRDAAFYRWLEAHSAELAHFEPDAMQYMIRRCAELHMQQIALGGDPFETGSARPLDFGHWSAHRLELLSDHELRHGEAVAIGVALDVRYSVLTGLLEANADSRICQLLKKLGFTLWHPELERRSSHGKLDVIEGLTDFKEHLGGELTITLLQDIGEGVEVHAMNEQLVAHAIEWLKEQHSAQSANVIPFDKRVNEPVATAAKSAVSQNCPSSNQTIEHLQAWLDARLSRKERSWLQERLRLVQNTPPDRDLYITLGLIPRKLGRDELNLSAQERRDFRDACGSTLNPVDWTVDTAARCLMICSLQQEHPAQFHALFAELCRTADLQESIAFYRCTAILPQSQSLDTVIGAGLRTHIRAIFEAIAHNNPYPKQHFEENRWNHMILKALFIDSALWPIQGIDERANPELAIILCDYAHERWAANRPVTPELWRCVGPFAQGTMLDDLLSVLNAPTKEADNSQCQQAALLALLACPHADQHQLRAQHPVWIADIDRGMINWNSIGGYNGPCHSR